MLTIQKRKIVFMHIPKTGGTSVHAAIRRHYRGRTYHIDPIKTRAMAKLIYASVPEIEKGTYLLRDGFILDAMQRDFSYISGHIHFNEDIWKAYSDKYSYLTLLREPVKRYISAYFFDSNKETGGSYTNLSFPDFVNSERGARLGNFYVNYLSGYPLRKDYSMEELSRRIETAKANLMRFSIVGILEDLEHFKREFRARQGFNLRIAHKNKSPVSKPIVEPWIVDKIRELCQADIEIYEFAKSQFHKSEV